MIELRNALIHHFIGQYDMTTPAGCEAAGADLTKHYRTINRHVEQLKMFCTHHNEACKILKSQLKSVPIHDYIAAPGIPWARTDIVAALREAAQLHVSQNG